MAVELDGNVRMRDDPGPGVRIRILAGKDRLRLLSGHEIIGDWKVAEIGMTSLHDGFNIKAEGEEFVLRTEDDVAFAEEIGIAAASPRLARRLAARHNPEQHIEGEQPVSIASNLPAVGFAIGGAFIVMGGVILDLSQDGDAARFWWGFLVGGVLMIAAALAMSVVQTWGRVGAVVVSLGMAVLFGFAVASPMAGTAQLTAFGFIAGGLVIGVAALSSGNLGRLD